MKKILFACVLMIGTSNVSVAGSMADLESALQKLNEMTIEQCANAMQSNNPSLGDAQACKKTCEMNFASYKNTGMSKFKRMAIDSCFMSAVMYEFNHDKKSKQLVYDYLQIQGYSRDDVRKIIKGTK